MPDVIFSASLSSIGRSTDDPGTAAAHLRYILRDDALENVVSHNIPENAFEAAAWITEQEVNDRINARVCDKLLLALPHQLSREQRHKLVKELCDEVSCGVPYLAALHFPSRDGDQRNFHCHIVFRDRDPVTGKRVMQTTERGSVERFRELAERHINRALADAGFDDRTDRRSHVERGLNRLAGVHVGPAATNAARRAERGGKTPAGNASAAQPLRSQTRQVRNSVGAHSAERVVEYPLLDDDYTRADENSYRSAINARLARAKARAASAARLEAARASMATLGLGMMSESLQQTKQVVSRIRPTPSRATAAVHAALGEPMPLMLDAWDEAEAFERAGQRIAAARSPRVLPVDTKASDARQLRAEAAASAVLHHAAEVADARLAAALTPRALPVDTKASLARQLSAEAGAAAALEHRAAEAAAVHLAAARSPRTLPVDAKASLARQLRNEAAEAAALEHRAAEVADARLAAALAPRALPVDTKAPVARQLRKEAAASRPVPSSSLGEPPPAPARAAAPPPVPAPALKPQKTPPAPIQVPTTTSLPPASSHRPAEQPSAPPWGYPAAEAALWQALGVSPTDRPLFLRDGPHQAASKLRKQFEIHGIEGLIAEKPGIYRFRPQLALEGLAALTQASGEWLCAVLAFAVEETKAVAAQLRRQRQAPGAAVGDSKGERSR